MTNSKLLACLSRAMVFEARVGLGRLLVCSIDLENQLQDRPAARQLRNGIFRYMESESFQPKKTLTVLEVNSLLRSSITR